ncbi:MAG TPA: Uma2 family endonuclease [Gemmataceae bacterium]|nr:Uma2 family endonuclease [Gemmataceae bacterium]
MSTTTTATPTEPRFGVLHGQTWQDYDRALAERDRLGRRYRITYDRGVLEIMPISAPHAKWQALIAGLLFIFATTKKIPVSSFGPLTCRREELDRGLEPDWCYYVQNEPRVRGRMNLDLDADPPPDLAVEVEVSREVIDRLGILAALGVPEVWRYDGERLTILVLDADGQYVQATASRALPSLPLDEFERRLAAWGTTDETTWLNDWQDWVRANVGG